MLIIDGHNLTFADEEAKLLLRGGKPEDSRLRILSLVELYARAIRHQTIIVFDGTGGGRIQPEQKRVRCVFSGAGNSADSEILRLIRESTGRREILLVTSDRTLAALARRLRAHIIPNSSFLKEADRLARKAAKNVREPAAKRSGAPRSDVEYWLRVFSDDDIRRAEETHGRKP